MRVRMPTEGLEHPFRSTECQITIAVKSAEAPFARTSEVRVHQNSEIKPIIEARDQGHTQAARNALRNPCGPVPATCNCKYQVGLKTLCRLPHLVWNKVPGY